MGNQFLAQRTHIIERFFLCFMNRFLAILFIIIIKKIGFFTNLLTEAKPWLTSGLVVGNGEKERERGEKEDKNLEVAFRILILKYLPKV